MMRKIWAFMVVGAIACAGLTGACGDDAGADNRPDGGPINTDGGGDGGPDGGSCTFASYVIGLVNTSTNATAKPDTTLGAGCKETTSQAEFKPLFP